MTEKLDSACWASEAAARLHKTADSLAVAPSPKYLGAEPLRFATLDVTADAAIKRLTDTSLIDRDRCLYVITLDAEADAGEVSIAFDTAKLRSELRLPQKNCTISDTLYIGSSCATKNRKATLRNRLRQHLIKAPSGTYALSLGAWASHLEGGIVVTAWQYPSMGDGREGDDTARGIVLAVEDWLASERKPMLGRRGSRY